MKLNITVAPREPGPITDDEKKQLVDFFECLNILKEEDKYK